MADLKISQLSPLTGANTAADDVLPIVDTNANQTKKIRADELFKSLSAGTAAAPAITPAGDQNTGVFFPAADTIAFSEGGAESVRLDSAGALTFAKSVYGSISSEDFYRIKLQDAGGIANDVGIGQPSTGSMGFNINPLGIYQWSAGTDGEVMQIDASGNLLVGTTASTGSASNARIVAGGIFTTVNGTTASTPTATAVTLFALPTNSTFMVTAYLNAVGDPVGYNAISMVMSNGGTSRAVSVATATFLTISLSGSNVQATQNSGLNQVITFRAFRIA